MPKPLTRAIVATRLKEVRQALGISQAELGVRMGLSEDVASTRINRYERGVHPPDFETAERMAKELGVPLAYLLTADERLATAILGFAKLSPEAQDRILSAIDKASQSRR